MSHVSSQRSRARRALNEDLTRDKSGWVQHRVFQHGIAALAVSVLGLGIAGSAVMTGNAQHTSSALTRPQGSTAIQWGRTAPVGFDRRTVSVSRSSTRPALNTAKVEALAARRAANLAVTDQRVESTARGKAARAREKGLLAAAAATQRRAYLLRTRQAARVSGTTENSSAPASSPSPQTELRSGRGSLPVTSGYTIAARFGAVGSWSRYHTGIDFSAPVGTPIHAPRTGVVTTAGSGSASGWAGSYVTIRHPDGTSTLYAHMSTVSVSVGQQLSAGAVLGAIGLTGRTFGPHLHFELYPAGVRPGDPYQAVNPAPWLKALGLNP